MSVSDRVKNWLNLQTELSIYLVEERVLGHGNHCFQFSFFDDDSEFYLHVNKTPPQFVIETKSKSLLSWKDDLSKFIAKSAGNISVEKILDRAIQNHSISSNPSSNSANQDLPPAKRLNSTAAAADRQSDDSDDSAQNDGESYYDQFDFEDTKVAPKEDDLAAEPAQPAAAVEAQSSEPESCVICMEELGTKNVRKLEKCDHSFHAICIAECFRVSNPQCPICKTLYGKPQGTQPAGTMTTSVISGSIPGFQRCKGIIQIDYSFPSGIQGPEHPSPGQPYAGTHRTAYLPNNTEGQEIEKLLRLAFDHRLIFTVGTSVTTGASNTTVWNGIHHKTSLSGGPQCFGYPDNTYLTRVKEEIAAVGITADMLVNQ